MTKDNAKEALTELYEKKLGDKDGYEAEKAVKKNFTALWEDHDVMKNGFIDRSEAYTLM